MRFTLQNALTPRNRQANLRWLTRSMMIAALAPWIPNRKFPYSPAAATMTAKQQISRSSILISALIKRSSTKYPKNSAATASSI